jgi:dipeptidyl aminopeptidase/acylaminoacyl peptidase
VHAKDDGAVPIANSENLEKALKAHNVPVKLVPYDKGGHGFGMRKRNIPADNWPEELRSWMKEMKICQ